jgi:hypothetical protein
VTDTPVARVAAFTQLAQLRGVDHIDSLIGASVPPRRHELRTADLAAVLDALADACDDHERCETCGQHMCQTCGIGDIATCPADRVHCTDPWCWCDACLQAHRDDQAADAAREDAI